MMGRKIDIVDRATAASRESVEMLTEWLAKARAGKAKNIMIVGESDTQILVSTPSVSNVIHLLGLLEMIKLQIQRRIDL